MWISKAVLGWLQISKETVEDQRIELGTLRLESSLLKTQLATTQTQFNWLRERVNALEMERAQLIKKAYGIDLPVPEIVVTKPWPKLPDQLNADDLFSDVGDDVAKKLGLPVYGN